MLIVIDDRSDMCKTMRRMMRLLRIPGDCFQRWVEAKEAIDEHPDSYKYALVDLALSNGDSGIEAIQWIRRNHPHIRCILMSGSRNIPPSNTPFSYHNFLPKPFDVDELVSVMS